MKRVTALALALFTVLALFCGCSAKSDEELIKDRINSFMKAYNSGDMDGVSESLSSKTRAATKAIFSMAEAMGGMLGMDGVSLSDLFSLGVAIAGDDVLDVSIGNIDITDEENATVETTLSLSYGDLVEKTDYSISFVMVKEDDDWFIDNMIQK